MHGRGSAYALVRYAAMTLGLTLLEAEAGAGAADPGLGVRRPRLPLLMALLG